MTFTYTGSSQVYTLPGAGCSSLQVTACGAAGGQPDSGFTPGYGICIHSQLLLPAALLSFYVMIGGIGAGLNPTVNLGWNGGGVGGTATWLGSTSCGGGGGGATDFRTTLNDLTTRFLVAAGGGGAAYDGMFGANGGDGGYTYLTGAAGAYLTAWPSSSSSGALGGTQTAGGAAGSSSEPGESGSGNAGSFGAGGDGVSPGNCGGGGWYGGGSGYWTGGGGGSSYIAPFYGLYSSWSSAYSTGNGYTTITCYPLPTTSPTPPPTGPSIQPSAQPSKQPSQQPTSHPSRPSGQPSRQPSGMAVVDIGLNPSIFSFKTRFFP